MLCMFFNLVLREGLSAEHVIFLQVLAMVSYVSEN